MNKNLSNLFNGVLCYIIYSNNLNKILVCKNNLSNGKLSLPIFKIDTTGWENLQEGKSNGKDISSQIITLMRTEFGLDPQIIDFFDFSKMVELNSLTCKSSKVLGYDTIDYGEYQGKPPIVSTPTGIFTESQYLNFTEIEEKIKLNQFDLYSGYYILNKKNHFFKNAELNVEHDEKTANTAMVINYDKISDFTSFTEFVTQINESTSNSNLSSYMNKTSLPIDKVEGVTGYLNENESDTHIFLEKENL